MAVANIWNFKRKQSKKLLFYYTNAHLSHIVHRENILLIAVMLLSYSEVQDLITINLIKTNFFLSIT